MSNIPLKLVYVIWTRLSFKDIATEHCSSKLSIEKEFEVFSKCFKEVDVASKVSIKIKLEGIAFPKKTSIYTLHDKVKTKGVVKARPTKFMRSTKRIPSYFEHVGFIHSQHDSCGVRDTYHKFFSTIHSYARSIHVGFHPYILDVVDVKFDGHCGYYVVAAELGMEKSHGLLFE